MGTLVRFELKKILGNRAGMAACALMLVMLVAVATLNRLTMDTAPSTYDSTQESVSSDAAGLEDEAKAKIEGILENGFWGYHPYTDAEKAYWRRLADEVARPLTWGYDGGWHYVITWKGFSGLAIVALCIALSGVFAGEYRDKTLAVVLPTRRGKRDLPIAKVIAAFVFTTGYWCVLAFGIVAIHLGVYGAEGWSLPLQVTLGLDNPYPLAVGQAVVASYALGYLVALGMAALTLLLSSRLRSSMPVAVIPMVIVFLGIIGLFSAPLAKVALLTPFSGLSYAFDAMVSYAVGSLVVDLPTVLAISYGTMFVTFVPCAIWSFRTHQAT